MISPPSALKQQPPAQPPVLLRQFLGPRYWPKWPGIALLYLLARLPFPVLMTIGRYIGLLSFYLAPSRRRVCEVNLRLCFPNMPDAEQRQLLRRNFISYGIALMEVAMAWYSRPQKYRERVQVSGLDNLQRAQAEGRGVLLVGAHLTTLEVAGFLSSLFCRMDISYRPNRNPLFEALMVNGRRRNYSRLIPRGDVRIAVRSLKAGRILWYGPDQDYGPKHSVFVPFFGVPTATITATARFARVNNSPVIFFTHYRNSDDSGYHLHFSPPLQDYPSGDDKRDARRINELIESAVHKCPEQYMWLHKRFKTRPGGKKERPY